MISVVCRPLTHFLSRLDSGSPVPRWTVGTGYNCIAPPSHSASTPICLFNIQLSTLDLEASATAQSRIRTDTSTGRLLWQTAAMIERAREREKWCGGGGDKVRNVVSETKVNERT